MALSYNKKESRLRGSFFKAIIQIYREKLTTAGSLDRRSQYGGQICESWSYRIKIIL